MELGKPDGENDHDRSQSLALPQPPTDFSTFSTDSTLFEIGYDIKPPVSAIGQNSNKYDPNRIPGSIFKNTSGNWSVASNDSLFSINSFSRNSSILRSVPEEPEWINSQPRLSEANSFEQLDLATITIPPIVELAPSKESSIKTKAEKKSLDITTKVVKDETNHPANAPHSRIISSSETPRLSNASTGSFAFPILVKDTERTESVNVAKEKPQSLQAQPLPKETTPKPKASSKKNRLRCMPNWSKRWCC